jgi:hypothetical protein
MNRFVQQSFGTQACPQTAIFFEGEEPVIRHSHSANIEGLILYP